MVVARFRFEFNADFHKQGVGAIGSPGAAGTNPGKNGHIVAAGRKCLASNRGDDKHANAGIYCKHLT
jgi:hypothetical protein